MMKFITGATPGLTSRDWETQTFSNLGKLPRLPVPTLAETVRRLEEWCAPLLDDQALQATRSALDEFARPEGPGEKLHQAIKDFDRQSGVDSWLDEFWPARYLGRRVPLAVNANFFFLFKQHSGNQIERATELVAAAVDYKLRLDREDIPPATLRGRPLCMVQQKYLFSTTRIPGETRDSVRTPYSETEPGPSSATHILVLHNGHLFRMEVITPTGEPYAQTVLAAALRDIVDASKIRQASDRAVGHLTTLARSRWADVRQQLIILSSDNAESIDHIETALFCLCLDQAKPDSTLAASDQLLHGDSANRWFDKSVSLVVFADGSAGINCEHCGLDGTTVVGFVDELHSGTTLERLVDPEGKSVDTPPFRTLQFKLNDSMRTEIAQAHAGFSALVSQTATTLFTFDKFGATHIKSLEVSPDAFAQIAFQLAHFRTKGRIGTTYESIATRTFERGRTEAMRVITAEIQAFISTMHDSEASREARIKAFRDAADKHVSRARECQNGQAPEQHLWQMQLIALKEGEALGIPEKPALFDSPGWRTMRGDFLSTSSAGSKNCSVFGFGATSKQCIGIGYIVWPQSITAYLSTPRSVESAMHEFAKQLRLALDELASLLEGDTV